MTKLPVSPILAAALATLLAPSLRAENYGRILDLGETINGSVSEASDADDFVFDGAAGWKVSVKAKRAKGADLAPVLELIAPDGDPTTEGVKAKAGKSSASLSATLVEGGRFAVRVTGASGTGGYVLSWKLKQGKVAKVKNQDLGPGTITRFPFPARGDTLLSWKLSYKGDGAAQVLSVEDPDGGDAGFDPEDDTYIKRTLTSESVKDFPLPPGAPGGEWNLVVENKLFSSMASLTIKMKLPKTSKTTSDLTLEEPVLDGISHSTSTCGVTVTLAGEHLGSAAKELRFGPNAAVGVSISGGKTITCSVPAGTGTVDIVFVALDGQVAVLEDAFTFEPLPVATGFEPSSGPGAGGIEMRIFGSGFAPGTLNFYQVLVGGVNASQVRVNEDGDTITCIMPAHVSGPKSVVLKNSCGEDIPVPGSFTYGTGLYIVDVRPEAVPAFGGVSVTVSGSNFAATDKVFLDGVEIPTTPVYYLGTVTGHRIEAADLPARAPGSVAIRVDSQGGATATKNPGIHYFSFSSATSTAIPAATTTDDWGGVSLALSDKDGDGMVDWIIVADTDQLSSVRPGTRVLKNNGSAVFSDITSTAIPAVTPTEGWGANRVLSGRLNADQIPDLYLSRAGTGVWWATGNWNEARMLTGNKHVNPWGTLLFPDSAGIFTAPVVAGPGGALGITGILVCNATWACVGVTRGSSVCYMYDYDFRSVNAAMGDLDGDFDQDVVLVNDESLADFTGTSVGTWVSCYSGQVNYQYYEGTGYGWATRILTSGSTGGLTDRTANLMETPATSDEDFRGVGAFVADISGDFLNDILIIHDEAMTKAGNPISAARLLVQKNSGSSVTYKQDAAFFPKPNNTSENDWRGTSILAADLNNDFYRDVIVSLDGPPPTGANFSTRILLQNPLDGKGVDRTDAILTGVLPAGDDGRASVVIARDIDKDGDTDLILGSTGNTGTGNRKTRLLLNAGTDPATGFPIFIDASSLFPSIATDPGNAVDIKLGDVDGDGDLDLVLTDTHVVDGTTKRTRVWKQDR